MGNRRVKFWVAVMCFSSTFCTVQAKWDVAWNPGRKSEPDLRVSCTMHASSLAEPLFEAFVAKKKAEGETLYIRAWPVPDLPIIAQITGDPKLAQWREIDLIVLSGEHLERVYQQLEKYYEPVSEGDVIRWVPKRR